MTKVHSAEEIIAESFNSLQWVWCTNVTDRQTDRRQTDLR